MKVKTLEELRAIIGERPRERKVLLCNGVFDLVHVGHIRHFRYAKTKADILVVSVTADQHVVKADYRPFVPQYLRAENVAECQSVDYVLIDDNPTARETIAYLQPDYYAKGYEYASQDIPEVEWCAQYGGEVIFSPGDVVYSSSAIIENDRPHLALEKLVSVMEAEKLGFWQLRDACEFSGVRVHVVGDTIVDTHTYCTPIGGITKTPTLSLRYEEQRRFVGGAGIVAKHLKAAGADVTFSTILGDDELGEFAWDDLTNAGIRLLNINNNAPTTHKNVFVADGYRMLKVDTVDNAPIGRDIVRKLQEQINASDQVVIFSDFRHGIFNQNTIPLLVSAMPAACFRAVDSQVASRWGNIVEFKDFDLATPNEREARFALGDQDSIVRALALALVRKTRCKTLILKLGERGILTLSEKLHALDSFARKAVDPVGAGDALLAYACLALFAGGNALVASVLGSIAAALECEREGNIPIGTHEMLARLEQLQKAANYENS